MSRTSRTEEPSDWLFVFMKSCSSEGQRSVCRTPSDSSGLEGKPWLWLSWDSIHPDGTNTQNDRLRDPASAKKHQRSVWGSLNFIPGTPPPASDAPLQQCPLKWAAKWNGASLVTAGEGNSWIRATARLSLHLHLFFPTTGINMVGCSVLPVTGALWVPRASSPVWCKYKTRRIMTYFLTLAAWIMF